MLTPTASNRSRAICIILMLAACFLTIILNKNSQADNDPRPNLFTSEAIIDHGTIKLDTYGQPLLRQIEYPYKFHYYNYFPIGTPIFSLPIVGFYRAIGWHVVDHERSAQIAVITVTSLLTLYLMFKIAERFLGWRSALAITAIYWYGSSLTSTNATGLWSHDFATMWATVALYLTLTAVSNRRFGLWPWIAAISFAAYLCRPTMALFAGVLLLFLATYDVRSAVKSGVLLALLFCIFVAWSFYEYGDPLPPYYGGSRLVGGSFWHALYGNLLSPSRGLLIFSPFIAIIGLCWKRGGDLGLKRSWLLLGFVWPLAHLVAISRFPHWWAGYSFGARLMTDVQPGLFLLGIRAWPRHLGKGWSAIAPCLLGLSGLFAGYVNTYQGLFNPYVYIWVAEPSIDHYPAYLFDWRYPQFLYNESRHQRRTQEHEQAAAALVEHLDALKRQASAGKLSATGVLDKSVDIDSLTPAHFSNPADFFVALYKAAFARLPSLGEVDYYVAYARANRDTPLVDYAALFLAAPEFTDKLAHYPFSSEGDAKFITDSFKNLLQRPPTTAEIAGYQSEVIVPAFGLYRPDNSLTSQTELRVRARVLVYLCVFSLWSSNM